MMNEEQILAVARYLEGDMELQEKETFESLIRSDAELRELIAEYKDVHQTLKMKIAPSKTDQQVEATLSTLTKQYFEDSITEVADSKSPVTLSLKPYLKWLSVAAVLVIGLLVWAPWSSSLYEKYAISKEMSVVERGAADKNNLEKAADFYNDADFISAADILQKEYALTPENAMIAYYYGVSLIETGKANEARAVLTKLYDGTSVFKYDAAYYVALSYVKEKNNPEALTWLGKIPAGTGNFEKARALTKKLQ